MKRFGLKTTKISSALALALLAALAVASPANSIAQQALGVASIHGHVQNAAGMAVNKGEIRLTTDRAADAKDRKYPYKFPIDPNGDYKGTGITPGNYVVFVFTDDKSVDFNESVVFANGDDKLVSFDMTRPEYLAKMSPEDRKALEEYKKKNAEIVAGNSKIQNLNALLTQARADNKSGNYSAALTAMQQATTAKPDEGILWLTMGDAQLGSADAAAKAAKAAGTPVTDPSIAGKYTDAVTSYKKVLELNAASKKPSPEVAATAYNQLGQAYARMGNGKDAADAYETAAKTQPANAAQYYFNEAATLFNAGKTAEAGVAADKAIAADPKKAEAYYIKGQTLIGGATVDPKTQKITAPPGCVEAYQTYLQLAPDGPHAADVKGILASIGEQVKSTYKAPKK